MNTFAFSLLIISIPTIFQLVFGFLSIYKKIKFDFNYINLICVILQIVFSFLGTFFVSNGDVRQGVKCGMPSVAFMFACFFMLIILIIITVVQFIWRYFLNRKPRNS